MNDFTGWDIFDFVFHLPYEVGRGLLRRLKGERKWKLNKEEVNKEQEKYLHEGYEAIPVSGSIISLFFWVLVAGLLVWNSTYTSYYYVYAFSNYPSSKSYHIIADVVKDDGWTMVNKICFSNTQYVTFSDCDLGPKSGLYNCWGGNSENTWTIDLAEKVRVPKSKLPVCLKK